MDRMLKQYCALKADMIKKQENILTLLMTSTALREMSNLCQDCMRST